MDGRRRRSAGRPRAVRIRPLQAKLARARTFLQVDNALVQLLARTAADKDDAALRDVLARNGVTFRRTEGAAPAPEPAK